MDEPIWVLEEAVMQIHRLQIQAHGGGAGVRDANLLASAMHRPKHLFSYQGDEVNLCQLAAA